MAKITDCYYRGESSGKHVHEIYTPCLYRKTRIYRGSHIFLFLIQNVDCGYSLEAVLSVPTIYDLNKNIKNIKIVLIKFFNFYSWKNLCILHRCVFIMEQDKLTPHSTG